MEKNKFSREQLSKSRTFGYGEDLVKAGWRTRHTRRKKRKKQFRHI